MGKHGLRRRRGYSFPWSPDHFLAAWNAMAEIGIVLLHATLRYLGVPPSTDGRLEGVNDLMCILF